MDKGVRIRLDPQKRGRKVGQIYANSPKPGQASKVHRIKAETWRHEAFDAMTAEERGEVIARGMDMKPKVIEVQAPRVKRTYNKKSLAQKIVSKLKKEGKSLETFIEEVRAAMVTSG